MNQEIIRMALEAGFEVNFDIWAVSVEGVYINKELQRFFHLAQAAEREACAKLCEEAELRFAGLWDRFAYPCDQGAADACSQVAAAIRAREQA
jgi:hypothetical protein